MRFGHDLDIVKRPFSAGPRVDKGVKSGPETRKWTRDMNYKTETPVRSKNKKMYEFKLKHAKIRVSDFIKRNFG